MKKPMLIFALAAATAFPASAADRPHRAMSVERQSNAPFAEVEQCMTKWGKGFGKPMPTVVDKGVSIDFQPGLFAGGGEPMWGVDIADRGEVRAVTMRYRHPFSDKDARNFFRNAAKKCKLGEEVPLAPAPM